MKFIDVHHPATGGRGRVTEDAFERLWESRGWRRANDDGDENDEGDLTRLRKQELIDRATSMDLEVDESMTKDELVAAIRGG